MEINAVQLHLNKNLNKVLHGSIDNDDTFKANVSTPQSTVAENGNTYLHRGNILFYTSLLKDVTLDFSSPYISKPILWVLRIFFSCLSTILAVISPIRLSTYLSFNFVFIITWCLGGTKTLFAQYYYKFDRVEYSINSFIESEV